VDYRSLGIHDNHVQLSLSQYCPFVFTGELEACVSGSDFLFDDRVRGVHLLFQNALSKRPCRELVEGDLVVKEKT